MNYNAHVISYYIDKLENEEFIVTDEKSVIP